MPFDYTSFITDIDAVVDDLGRTATLSIRSETPLDANQPWRGTSATVATAVANVVPYGFNAEDIDGTIIRRGDTQFVVAAKDLTSFDTNSVDTLTLGSEVWGILSVKELNPGGAAIAFILHGRK